MNDIVICGELYSQNLGDGIILESLQHLIRALRPATTVRLFDLSCRTGFQFDQPVAASSPVKSAKAVLVRSRMGQRAVMLSKWYLQQRQLAARCYDSHLSGAALLIVGGGQLLMDKGLRFPLRLNLLVKHAARLGLQVAFYACGVEPHWSTWGRKLLREALLHPAVTAVSTRDNLPELLRLVPALRDGGCTLTSDAALWAGQAYACQRDPAARCVGVGVMAYSTYQQHPSAARTVTARTLRDFWFGVMDELTARQIPFQLFTNGGAHDTAFAEELAGSWERGGAPTLLAPRPESPRQLVETIARYRAVVAPRLHANIVAYALGIPSIGLVWDSKLEEFARRTQRERFFVKLEDSTPAAIGALLEEAMVAGVEMGLHAALVHETYQNVADLLTRTDARSQR